MHLTGTEDWDWEYMMFFLQEQLGPIWDDFLLSYLHHLGGGIVVVVHVVGGG